MLELFEDPLLIARLNADARVDDRHAHGRTGQRDVRRRPGISPGFVLKSGRHGHSPAIRGELDGVAEEVVHDLLELRFVGEE